MIAVLVALVSAEATEPSPPTKQALRTITAKCKVPARWLRLRKDGSVQIRLPANPRYEDVDCLLAKLKAYNVTNLGFVGNEAGQ